MAGQKIKYGNCFLGLDLSTQSLTAVIIVTKGEEIHQFSINFDDSYPLYKTKDGVLVSDDPSIVHADPRMWVEAVDDMLNLLKEKGLTSHIDSIAVSAQQHGTVYLNHKAAYKLSHLNPSLPSLVQLRDIFSRPTSPVWMDSSSHIECLEITEALGGDLNVARLTGSRATERFAGPQIRKFWKQDPEGYQQTTNIAIISSFITSLLCGRIAPLDCGDGYGTNLANIRTGRWSKKALAATAPNLRKRLPKLHRKNDSAETISDYLVKRYGFHPHAEVITGSGDNPSSLVGLGLIGETGRKAISLGTSDTYFGYMPRLVDTDRSEGHIFGTADDRYMFLLCFKNGGLAREKVKELYNLSWNEFSEILLTTHPGNNGKIMLPYFMPEITPFVPNPAVFRFGGLAEDDLSGNVRAIAEAQAMAMYIHSEWVGRRSKTILVTAGGSENKGLLKVISQVSNAEVQSSEVKNSAALGAAFRAAHWTLNKQGDLTNWSELANIFIKKKISTIIYPKKEEHAIYHGNNGLLNVYKSCEKFALGLGENPEEQINLFKKSFC